MPRSLATVAVLAGALLALAVSPASAGGLDTAVLPAFDSVATALPRVEAAGASFVRLNVVWSTVAPPRRPTGFDPGDPGDPAYRWAGIDAEIRAVVARGLTPYVTVVQAPAWARRGSATSAAPDPVQLGFFMRAIATRYSGDFDGLPRVRYWQVWNEPNLTPDLSPQLVNGKAVSPGRYRGMVNAFAGAVKAVHADNLVIAGGLAPFRDITPEVLKQDEDWGPLSFMRDLLCLSRSLKPTCNDPVRFDIWSMHPYTSGGPTHHAVLPDDVSLGDLPKVRWVLQAAVRAGHISSRGPVKFWVTEFSWDSNPPDPKGVPMRLLDRWVPQALYVMWRNGISLVTWFSVRDQPLSTSFYQSGLYFRSGKPKPFLEGFRFPLVAFPRAGGIYVWGRTPFGDSGRVEVELRDGSRWRLLGTLRTDAHGIFRHQFPVSSSGLVRARVVSSGERSLPFSLTPVPDQFFNPFGETTLLEPVHP